MSPTARLPRLLRLALIGLLVAGFAVPAEAAPRCYLLKDAEGDAGVSGGDGGLGSVPGTYDGSLDVVSADIATNRTQLTAVIRVAKLTMPENPLPYGGMFSFHWTTGEAAFFVEATRTYAGDRFHANVYTSPYSGDTSQSFLYDPLGPVSGVFDEARNEVRITAPLALFAPHDRIGPGTTLTKLLVITWFSQALDEYPTSSQADEVGGGGRASYRAGDRTCVAVGR
ncbi:MAG TPA: hypothetical protein VNA12_05595 [Mycobacteriales bacterium]|nr:hypothetical protein [Mycobacteriales bacterium]